MAGILELEPDKPLLGFIELGDAYLGGKRTGCKPRRGAAGKTPFITPVQITEQHSPVRIKFTKVSGFRGLYSGLDIAAGNSTQKVEPLPDSLSTPMVPAIFSIRPLAMTRPMPRPLIFVCSAPSRSKAENSWLC